MDVTKEMLNYAKALKLIKPEAVKRIQDLKLIVTHCGTMHADEVFCIGFINAVKKTIEFSMKGTLSISSRVNYIRVEDQNDFLRYQSEHNDIKNFQEDQEFWYVDIMPGIYDHHNPDIVHKREDGKSMASIGIMLKDILTADGFELVYNDYLEPVDQRDSYGQKAVPNSPLSDLIGGMNLVEGNADRKFIDSVNLATNISETILLICGAKNEKIKQFAPIIAAKKEAAAKTKRPDVIVFEENEQYIAKEFLEGHGITFAIVPSNRRKGKWTLNAIDSSIEPIPSSIEFGKNGCIFAHKDRFTATFDSKEDALASVGL